MANHVQCPTRANDLERTDWLLLAGCREGSPIAPPSAHSRTSENKDFRNPPLKSQPYTQCDSIQQITMTIWWEPIRQFSIELSVFWTITSLLVLPLIVARRLRSLWAAQQERPITADNLRSNQIHWLLSALLIGMVCAPGIIVIRAFLDPLDGKFPLHYPWYDPDLSAAGVQVIIQQARVIWRTYFVVLALLAWVLTAVLYLCILRRRYPKPTASSSASS